MTARTVLLVLGSGATALLVGGAAYGTVEGAARQRTVQARDLPVADRYVVETGGRFELRRGPIELEVGRSWSFARPEVSVQHRGDEVHVEADCWAGDDCDVDLVLTVPAGTDVAFRAHRGRVVGTRGAVEARVHGDLEVVRHTGPLDVDSFGGGVQLGGVRGDVDVTTRGGDLVASGLEAERVRVRTFGGEADLSLVTRPELVDAESLAGDLLLQVPPGDYDLDVEARAGDDELGVRDVDGASSVLRLVSTGGDVVVTAG